MPHFSEVELWKQVWTGGQALLSPSETSGLGLGIPARRPPSPILPGGLGEGALGKDRPEEEEKGNRKQSTESGLKFTVFGRKQQLSTGRLGAVEAQSGFLPSGAGASSCGDKTWREGREVAVSRGVALELNPGLALVTGCKMAGRGCRWEKGRTQPEYLVRKLRWTPSTSELPGSGRGRNRGPRRKPGSRTLFLLGLWASTY